MSTFDILDPRIPPLRDNHFLIGLIAEISGTPLAEVAHSFKLEHGDLGGSVRRAMVERGIPFYKWTTELERFYATTDAFLYETVVWNRSEFKNDMRRWIGAYLASRFPPSLRILTFGDGLGIDSYYLAELGHDVTYFDVSQKCTCFARRIFERDNVSVTMINSLNQLEPNSFDAVLCLDVLEHVPDPLSLVGFLSGMLQQSGKLIVHAPFHYIHPAVTTHLRTNRCFSGDLHTLYAPHGLYPVDGQLFWNPLVLEKSEIAKSERIPKQLQIGSWILGIGRYWSTIHNLVAQKLIKTKSLRLMAEYNPAR